MESVNVKSTHICSFSPTVPADVDAQSPEENADLSESE